MRKNQVETVMGAVVIAIAVIFLVFAYTTADIRRVQGYHVSMRFDRVDGLRLGTDVRMSGIKIGSVTQQVLDPQTYLAVVTASIDPSVKLPEDSSAAISSDGLLGEKYLAIVPGASDKMLPAGGEIEHTQGSVDLIGLVGRLMFSQTGDKDKAAQGGSQQGGAK
ncbi:MAG TPA: outer membrane lipid asymmetry maintenance protein MlaD [Alphaproteobacteria bacterium]|jgi:phospholipid/cholesterol/gamma-HCH transport system substrate-binding protein